MDGALTCVMLSYWCVLALVTCLPPELMCVDQARRHTRAAWLAGKKNEEIEALRRREMLCKNAELRQLLSAYGANSA